jgi:putative endonuclease
MASDRAQLGQLGEQLVADWLQQDGWQIVAQRWHCRWGELDIVGYGDRPRPTLIFVEVKTRSPQNWDADGRLAITPQKQAKIIQTAELFLSEQPQWSEADARFDVAIVQGVRRHPIKQHPRRTVEPLNENAVNHSIQNYSIQNRSIQPTIRLGTPTHRDDYRLTLQDYIPAAFGEL